VLPLLNVLQRNFAFIVIFMMLSFIGCGRNERMDTLYAQRCMNCHGAGGRGDGPLAAKLPAKLPDFRDTVERKSNGQIRRVIADGAGIMPAFGPALTPSEINDMLQMVRFLSRDGRDVAWWEKFDTLVVAHCSVPWETVLGYDEPTDSSKP
jgi:cbb3-type cytochrome c oxidase subunit III